MTQARPNIFDATLGVSGQQTWLDSKVMRRELTEDLQRAALTERKSKAEEEAEMFREILSKRAEKRDGLEKKSAELRKLQEEIMRRKADEYRERLRSKLRPDVWD
jgi:hypothetical protein